MTRPTFPYANHRTVEQVDRDRAEGCLCELVEERGDADDCLLLLRLAEEET